MKLTFLLALFFFFGSQSQAVDFSVYCENGDAHDRGDSYFAVVILEEGIRIMPYEGGVEIDFDEIHIDIGNTGSTYAITNTVASGSSEGEVFSVIVNAMINVDKSGNTMQMAYSFDNRPFITHTLSCRKN